MRERFDQMVSSVRQKFADLCACAKYQIAHLPKGMPSAGVYLFSEDGRALYVGRSNTLRKRLQHHTRNNHNQATFAFLLARRQTGNLTPSYQVKGSRQDLLNDPAFRGAFDSARERIRKMDVQYVEERDPIKQTVLEVFAAYESEAEYNDFDNH